MPKFEKRFVHVMWSDELEGKEVFYADNIDELEEAFDNNCMGIVTKSPCPSLPFVHDFACYRFVYYDPYYNLKVSFEQGKVIQGKHGLTGEWIDIEATNINWEMYELEGIELRVKPEETKPVTDRELARWLAQGNGEYYEYDCDGWESHRCIEYQYEQDNLPVSKVMVRKWEDTEWHEPTREYMGLED